MIQTNNFGLKLFEGKDKFDYKVMNENWQRFDDALDELLNGGNGAVLPFMTAEKVDNGYRITITDAKGTQSFILPSYVLTDADKQEIADLAGANTLIVTITGESGEKYTLSHTTAEINEAVLAGKYVFLRDNTKIYILTYTHSALAHFQRFHSNVIELYMVTGNNATHSVMNYMLPTLTINETEYDGSEEVDMTNAVQTMINEKIKYGTTEVTDGATSDYPEGTLYVVID